MSSTEMRPATTIIWTITPALIIIFIIIIVCNVHLCYKLPDEGVLCCEFTAPYSTSYNDEEEPKQRQKPYTSVSDEIQQSDDQTSLFTRNV